MYINKELESLIQEFKNTGKICVSENYLVCPGLCDVHVHFREPGFSYKETIKTGSMAAAHGGYTTVCTMPNLNPCPDTMEHLKMQLDIIEKDAVIDVIPYGTITINEEGKELSDMDAMKNLVCAFSDDGRGVQNDNMMKAGMIKAKELNKVIAAHCEDNSLLHGGCIHEGIYAKEHGFIGISSASEYKQIERDLKLVEELGVAYHVCHISTKESVNLIRNAKLRGVNVTCETAPHYLTLTENDLKDEGRFKMNPPVRSLEDRAALIEGIKDGTIDVIATDHAPHSLEEKAKGLKGSPFGIVGLETAFPILYTELVLKEIITLEKLVELLTTNPRNRFNLPIKKDDYAVFEIKNKYKIDSKDFLSMGKASPFDGKEVYGKCILTVCNGKEVYKA